MEPVSVSRHNRKQVLKNLYGGLRNEKPKAPRFKIGDIVRINKQKLHFEKGYEQNWRRELFIVFEIVQRIPIVYRLKDLQGEEIKAGDGNISSTVKRTIDVGCYETMLDIISAVQLALPKNPNRFTIIYNKATKRVKINAVQGSSLHLENLGELLGFKHNAIIIGNMKSEFVADAWSNFSVFYVYSDLISPQIVGDTQAPLLRIVRTKGKDGETISQYYDRPQYLPLVRHSF
ncbi:uncharacterized protein TNCV_1032571 [Trichonephila clavipes]|nr:uncharacterized protein TNCV_1032571 [Trichonephila clavipes]